MGLAGALREAYNMAGPAAWAAWADAPLAVVASQDGTPGHRRDRSRASWRRSTSCMPGRVMGGPDRRIRAWAYRSRGRCRRPAAWAAVRRPTSTRLIELITTHRQAHDLGRSGRAGLDLRTSEQPEPRRSARRRTCTRKSSTCWSSCGALRICRSRSKSASSRSTTTSSSGSASTSTSTSRQPAAQRSAPPGSAASISWSEARPARIASTA